MKRISLFVISVCAGIGMISAQTDTLTIAVKKPLTYPFNYHLPTDISILGAAGICWTSTLFIEPETLNAASLGELDAGQLWQIDQYATTVDSASAMQWKLVSDISNFSTFIAPAAVGIILLPQFGDDVQYASMYAEGFLLTYGITQVLKESVSRPRPYTYADAYSNTYRLDKDEWASFPSAHTSSAAFNTFFTAYVIDHLWLSHSEVKVLRLLNWGAAVAIPAFTGFSRVQAGRHFPTDVAAGYFIGASMGLLVPWLHTKPNTELSMVPGGFSLVMRF